MIEKIVNPCEGCREYESYIEGYCAKPTIDSGCRLYDTYQARLDQQRKDYKYFEKNRSRQIGSGISTPMYVFYIPKEEWDVLQQQLGGIDSEGKEVK